MGRSFYRRHGQPPQRMPAKAFALLRPRLRLPVGFEAYEAQGEPLKLHPGQEGECRVCLLKCFEGDPVRWVKIRLIGTTRQGAKSVRVHEACVLGPAPLDFDALTCDQYPGLPVLEMDEDRLRLCRAAGRSPDPSHHHADPDRQADWGCWGRLRPKPEA